MGDFMKKIFTEFNEDDISDYEVAGHDFSFSSLLHVLFPVALILVSVASFLAIIYFCRVLGVFS